MGNTYRVRMVLVADGDAHGFILGKNGPRKGKRHVRREQRRDHARQTRAALVELAADRADDAHELMMMGLDDYFGHEEDHLSRYMSGQAFDEEMEERNRAYERELESSWYDDWDW